MPAGSGILCVWQRNGSGMAAEFGGELDSRMTPRLTIFIIDYIALMSYVGATSTIARCAHDERSAGGFEFGEAYRVYNADGDLTALYARR